MNRCKELYEGLNALAVFRGLLRDPDGRRMCRGENGYQNATRKGAQSLAVQGPRNSCPGLGYRRGYQKNFFEQKDHIFSQTEGNPNF